MGVDIFRLDGKVAWVTGGTKGLGEAMADALAGAGADVVINSRTADEAEAVASRIAHKHGRRGLGMAADVTQPEQVQSLVDRAKVDLGGIDILINNAGVNVRQPTVDLPVEEWQRVIDINLTGPFLGTQAVASAIRDSGG